MNSRQKEAQQAFLDDEAEVIRSLKRAYDDALENVKAAIEGHYAAIERLTELIDALAPGDPARAVLESQRRSKAYRKDYQESLERQLSDILRKMADESYRSVSDYLGECYEGGFLGAMYDIHGQGVPLMLPIDQPKVVKAVALDSKISGGLYARLGKDAADLKRKIASQVARSMAEGESYSACAKALERQTGIGFNRSVRIARTEGHRVQVSAAMDACLAARDAGADVVKQWDSTLDRRTRPSHAHADGEVRELDEPFGNGLMFPGDPDGRAAEVVNCRCALLERARWALDEAELETLKERAEYFGLDKAGSFAEFRERYMGEVGEEGIDAIERKLAAAKEKLSKAENDKSLGKYKEAEINRIYKTYGDVTGVDEASLQSLSSRKEWLESRNRKLERLVDIYYQRPRRGDSKRAEWDAWKAANWDDSMIDELDRNQSELLGISGEISNWRKFKSEIESAEKMQSISSLDSAIHALKSKVDFYRLALVDAKVKAINDSTGVLARAVRTSDNHYAELIRSAILKGVKYKPVGGVSSVESINESIRAISGGDLTDGSCASAALAYIGRRQGWNVLDFRGGGSMRLFSRASNLHALSLARGMKTLRADGASSLTVGNRLLKQCEAGKEYYLCVGRHAAIVRKTRNGDLQYLELQSEKCPGWTSFGANPGYTLRERFGCTRTSSNAASVDFMIDIAGSDFSTDEFKALLGFLNTARDKQRKGADGDVK